MLQVCRVWRYKVFPQLGKIISMIEKPSACPTMYAGLDRSCINVEDPDELLKVRNHMQTHLNECIGCMATDFGEQALADLDDWLPLVRRWSWHWWHAAVLQQEYQQMLAEPQEATWYVCMDFQDHCTAPPRNKMKLLQNNGQGTEHNSTYI